jgi:hypothetical protein
MDVLRRHDRRHGSRYVTARRCEPLIVGAKNGPSPTWSRPGSRFRRRDDQRREQDLERQRPAEEHSDHDGDVVVELAPALVTSPCRRPIRTAPDADQSADDEWIRVRGGRRALWSPTLNTSAVAPIGARQVPATTATTGPATISPGVPISEGENLQVDPPRRLVQSFRALWGEHVVAEGTSRVTWEIEPVADSCRLTVTHDQLRDGVNEQLYGGWPMILSGLKTLLETGGGPHHRWLAHVPRRPTAGRRRRPRRVAADGRPAGGTRGLRQLTTHARWGTAASIGRTPAGAQSDPGPHACPAPRSQMPRPDADAMAAMGCRTSMMTVGGTVDCWIAQLAIEHSAALLHRDRDFEHISRVALSSRR